MQVFCCDKFCVSSLTIYKLNVLDVTPAILDRRFSMQCCFREHVGSAGMMRLHLEECNTVWNSTPDSDLVQILDQCNSLPKLMALEALYIKKLKPDLNTKDELRSRTLTLKLYKSILRFCSHPYSGPMPDFKIWLSSTCLYFFKRFSIRFMSFYHSVHLFFFFFSLHYK